MIGRLLEAGAVGLNVEDTVHSEAGRLRISAEQAELVAALRTASDKSGVHMVLNARTDVILHQLGDESDRIDRAIARLCDAADAGPTASTPSDSMMRTPTGAWRPSCPCLSTPW